MEVYVTYNSAEVTRSKWGKDCQPWNLQSSYSHLGKHSFCRNPDKKAGPWCFITDQDWEYCIVRESGSEKGKKEKDDTY